MHFCAEFLTRSYSSSTLHSSLPVSREGPASYRKSNQPVSKQNKFHLADAEQSCIDDCLISDDINSSDSLEKVRSIIMFVGYNSAPALIAELELRRQSKCRH